MEIFRYKKRGVEFLGGIDILFLYMSQIPSSTLLSQLEAILFLQGDILSYKKIASLLSITDDEVKTLCSTLEEALSSGERGLMLVKTQEGCQFATRPEHAELVEAFLKEDIKEELTPATTETLSLIAYFGPITRSDVDYIRGVNSTFTIRTLLVRGLIEKVGQEGHSYLYQVSADFLKHLGIASQEELPQYESYKELHKKLFEKEEEISEPVEEDHEF